MKTKTHPHICSVHNEIMDKATEIIRLKPSMFDDVDECLRYVENLADKIYSLANEAFGMANDMEDRLKEYRETIESLGFIRKK